MSLFSERLRSLRAEKGELQADAAKAIDVSIGSYSAYETGREPKYDVLCRLARRYDVTVDYLVGNSNERKAENTAVAESLGLSEQALETLKDCFDRDKANSITLTINALLEQRYTLGAISRYLYYDIQNADRDSSIVPFRAKYRYVSKCRDAQALWEANPKSPIDYEVDLDAINNEMYKRLLLAKVDDQMKELLEVENGKDRLKDYIFKE